MKGFKATVVLLLATAFVLSGCSFLVPEEYKDGVKVDRSYPDDELPIYDDAIVFASEEDDDEITLLMGTKDDLDDIVDFYKDHFEDEGILLTNEKERKSSYTAEGHVQGYDFELKVQAASGKWEEKLFAHVIEIVVTPAEDPVVQVSATPSQAILGTWAMTNVKLAGADITADSWEILMCTYYEDGTGHEIYKWPYQPEKMEQFTWQIEGDQLTITYEDESIFITAIDTLNDTSFIELAIEANEGFDTIIYQRVANEAWRPESTTQPYDDPATNYYGDPADINDIYGAWTSYNASLALWPDGTGRQWHSDYDFGWDITWEYYTDGWLYVYYGEDSYESYYTSFDGEYLIAQNQELNVYEYLSRPDYSITYVSWVLMYDSSSPDYVYDPDSYLYFLSDNTYEIYYDYTVTDTGTWEISNYGDLSFDNSEYYYYFSYEGDWMILYDGQDYYWYQSLYTIE